MMVDLPAWLNLGLRWLHLTTGIAWIGASFYFVWLDMHLKPPADGEASGELWAVHGGGFYHNQKYQVAPRKMPPDLHWFKWEAYATWLSGSALFVLIYYFGARTFLIDSSKANLDEFEAIGLSLAALLGAWLFYHLLCKTKLGDRGLIFGGIWFGALVAATYGLTHIFNSRAAYLQIGAMIGTVMVANVFYVIIPNQRKAVAALIAGHTPDPALGKAGKQRSLHNNYMTLPVLFIMISNHYPMTYGASRPWLVLALLGLTGVVIRHVFNLRNVGRPIGPTVALAAALAAASIGYVSNEQRPGSQAPDDAPAENTAGPAETGAATAKASAMRAEQPGYASVAPILARHCSGCHSLRPTNSAFTAPPLGIILDNYEHVRAHAPRIKAVTVDSEVMPLGNATGMTRAERDAIGTWIDGGAAQ